MTTTTDTSYPLQHIAVFGTGQVGRSILKALLHPVVPGYRPTVHAFVLPGGQADKIRGLSDALQVHEIDFARGGPALVDALRGIDAVVSALNGKGIDAQYAILDAAAQAGVRRFFPSEYGFRQVYRAPGDAGGRIHPLDDEKIRFAVTLMLHPAVNAGKLMYTIVNCGDFYNQPAETWWYPFMDLSRSSYEVPVVGDGEALVDWAHLDDLANYVCAMLAKPALSANRTLNVPSVTCSQNATVDALRKHAARPVHPRHITLEDAHRFVADPGSAPQELKDSTRFPPDYWFVVKTTQGTGRGMHPRPELHNALFPEVKPTSFEDYFAHVFSQQR